MNFDLNNPETLELLKNIFEDLLSSKKKEDIQTIATQAFINYAASTILSRAIPDILDGLKPVQRRILQSMKDIHLVPSSMTKKSAKIVGQTLASYHPHGDNSVYEAMIGLAQPWNKNIPLIYGQGNIGSQDKDPFAAMRYTEARLSKAGFLFFQDIDKNIVDTMPNYDSSEEEYTVLPAMFPNLLINGSFGVSTGLSTNIPLHNPNEVLDLLLHMIKLRKKGKEISTDEIYEFIQAPDFPTGGIIYDNKAMKKIIETGEGIVKLRATYEIEKVNAVKQAIIITSIPYKKTKPNIISKIVDLVKEKQLTGIAAIRDESNKNNVRIYIELKQGTDINFTWNYLLKHTELDENITYKMVVLKDGGPKKTNFKEIIESFIDFRMNIQERKYLYLKNNINNRLEIVNGLLIALEDIDKVIKIIKAAESEADAISGLTNKFKLSLRQAEAILEMKIQRLIGLEKLKLEKERENLHIDLEYANKVISSADERLNIVLEESKRIKKEIGCERQTKIDIQNSVEKIDVVKKEDCLIYLTKKMYIKRDSITRQKEIELQDDDFILTTYETNTHELIMCFTKNGKVYSSRICDISDAPKGRFIENVFSLDNDDHIVKILKVEDFNDSELIFITKNGFVKKSLLNDYEGSLRTTGINGIKLEDEDIVIDVFTPNEKDDMILISEKGMLIRFDHKEVPVMGRASRGVIGIRTDANIISGGQGEIITCLFNDYLKVFKAEDFSKQKRAGKGVILEKNMIKKAYLNGINNEIMVFFKNDVNEIKSLDKELFKGYKSKNIIDIIIKETRSE